MTKGLKFPVFAGEYQDGRPTQPETNMRTITALLALAAFAAVSNQDYRDAELVSQQPITLACIHCGER